MRIVLISPEYPPGTHTGGIGTNTATVARALARRGHDVRVVTRGPGDEYADEGVSVLRLDRRWLPSPVAEHLLANRQIAAAARRFHPDIVQAPEYEGEAWWLARWSEIPIVTRLATPTYVLAELNRWEPSRRRALVQRLERSQARRSAAVIAPTRSIAERVGGDWRLPAELVEIVPNPIDLEGIDRAGAGAPPFELPARYVVFIGRLERRKGLEALGPALASVLRSDAELHAVLIGRDPGEEGGELMRRFRDAVAPVSERVHVLGELPREQALPVVARADLVVLPSLWESFGYVCVEAMALGRPVVASGVGGFAEIVDDGQDGWLVPPGDPTALAEAIARHVRDRDGLRRIGEAARQRARAFDEQTVVDELVSLYERVLARQERGFDSGIYLRGYRRYFKPDDRRDPFHALYEAKRRAILGPLERADRLRILDVGGGYGRLAGPLAERHDVTLCDISPEMLAEAGSRWPGLTLVQADARSLPFADGEFDVVLAVDLLVHLPELEPGVREFARVARSGGRVVFDTTNASPWWVLAYPAYVNWRPRRLLVTMLAGGVLPEWRKTVRHHRGHDVERAIERAGLRLERLERFGPPLVPKWHLWRTAKD